MSAAVQHASAAHDCQCYHCGQDIPSDVLLEVSINGQSRAMCCHGCQSVAQAIVDGGLSEYYRSRDAMPESQREARPEVLDNLSLYDHQAFQQTFVRELGEGEREAALLIEGITCAACIWLNESHLARLPGVLAVDLNYATRRARVRWDERRIKLSAIIAAVAAIGYRAHPYDAAKNEELARKERRTALWRVWVAGFGMMQVMMYAIPVYLATPEDMSLDIAQLLRWASLILTLPVVFYSAAPFFRNAWRDLRMRRVGMDVPVALGVGAAFVASVWATLIAAGEVYFDSVTMFVFFLLGGRYLEMVARQQAVSVTEALAKMMPTFAERVPGWLAGQRETEKVVAAELLAGDVVLIRPGATIPADGRVLEGESAVNESLLTGESVPVAKRVGDEVTGGAINADSPLFVRVEQVGEGSRLSSILRLMERAASERPRIVEVADRVAAKFVGIVLLVSLVCAVFWWEHDKAQALWVTVSVLVVTCPCALSLATPIALTVASGTLARHGLLVTRGHAVETLARATHFVFDKTGTVTTGQMTLLETLPLGALGADEALGLAAGLESGSEHPLSQALRRGAKERGLTALAVQELQHVAGQGIAADIDGVSYRIGRPGYVQELAGVALPAVGEALLARPETVIALGRAGEWLALFLIGDALRPEAREVIAALHEAGAKVLLLTGDAEGVARRVGEELGVDVVRAQATPQDKHAFVEQLQKDGAVVAMVGDGVNDAPVLAQAQVSIAMGGGAQLARTQADMVLLAESLLPLKSGYALAGRCVRVVRQNLWWSFAYNMTALPLAMAGFVTPWLAGIGMSGSSVLVVLNSLRLQRWRK